MPPKGDDDTASTSGETANTASTAGVPPKGGGGRAKKGGGRRKKIDDATGTKLQKKLKAATMGTSISKLLKRYEDSDDGQRSRAFVLPAWLFRSSAHGSKRKK